MAAEVIQEATRQGLGATDWIQIGLLVAAGIYTLVTFLMMMQSRKQLKILAKQEARTLGSMLYGYLTYPTLPTPSSASSEPNGIALYNAGDSIAQEVGIYYYSPLQKNYSMFVEFPYAFLYPKGNIPLYFDPVIKNRQEIADSISTNYGRAARLFFENGCTESEAGFILILHKDLDLNVHATRHRIVPRQGYLFLTKTHRVQVETTDEEKKAFSSP